MWALPAGPDPAAPPVAEVTSLIADVAGVAFGALVDGLGLGHDRLDRRRPPLAPRALATNRRAEALAPEAIEGHATAQAGGRGRRGVVAHGVHATCSSSWWRSTSTPSVKRAPARTRATRWAPVTARQRCSAAFDELEGHGQAGRSRPRSLGHLGPKPHGGEGGLDGVGGPQVDPVLGREVEEGQEGDCVVDDLGHGLWGTWPHRHRRKRRWR